MRSIKNGVTVIVALLLALTLLLAVTLLPQRLAFRGGESYTFFIGDTSKDCKEVTCSGKDANRTRLTLQGVCGESATYSRLNLSDFLVSVKGEVVFCERLDDSVNYYCTASLPYSVTLYGKRINLHICVKEDGVTVGTPIIFGGY